jgi:hypothetical membrane protein
VDGAVTLERIAPWAGMVGSVAIAGCAIVTAVAYRGTAGELFSPFNHYVSELGELGVSSLAVVFNSGLVVGGLAFALFMTGLGRVRGGLGGSAYGAIGGVAGIAGASVGLFPLNSLGTHTIAAFFFFNLGWISVALASVDALVRPDPRFPVRTAAVGFATVGAFVAFVWAYVLSGSRTNGLAPSDVRPTFDIVTVFEWLAIVGIVAWGFLVGWDWKRAHVADAA